MVGAGAVAAASARSWTARAAPAPNGWAKQLVAAAESQIGVTTIYDPSYVRIDYPGGDVPRDRGVCTDVIVRAYRDAFHLDLQVLVHEDMKRNFAAYPQSWGLPGPDPNIEQRIQKRFGDQEYSVREMHDIYRGISLRARTNLPLRRCSRIRW